MQGCVHAVTRVSDTIDWPPSLLEMCCAERNVELLINTVHDIYVDNRLMINTCVGCCKYIRFLCSKLPNGTHSGFHWLNSIDRTVFLCPILSSWMSWIIVPGLNKNAIKIHSCLFLFRQLIYSYPVVYVGGQFLVWCGKLHPRTVRILPTIPNISSSR